MMAIGIGRRDAGMDRATARDLGYIGADVAERWQGEYREIARMLHGPLTARSSDP